MEFRALHKSSESEKRCKWDKQSSLTGKPGKERITFSFPSPNWNSALQRSTKWLFSGYFLLSASRVNN